MNSLNTIVCDVHTPFVPAISNTWNMCFEEQFTFCTECEQNIERWADVSEPFSPWSKWKVSN